jgi:hypothetical protein
MRLIVGAVYPLISSVLSFLFQRPMAKLFVGQIRDQSVDAVVLRQMRNGRVLDLSLYVT